MVTYAITPLYLGEVEVDKSMLTMLMGIGEKVWATYYAFLLRGSNGKNILVDTGIWGLDEADRRHPGRRWNIPAENALTSELAARGVQPGDIDYIILTHLHWDHCCNLELFPGKRVYVQKAEVDYAVNPLPIHRNVYESPASGNMLPPWWSHATQLEFVDGDADLGDGIKLVFLPGHTPGNQGVLVETEKGAHLVTGDAVMVYDNWFAKGPFKHIYSALHVDLTDFQASYDKIGKLEQSHNVVIIPGHEPSLKDRVFPE